MAFLIGLLTFVLVLDCIALIFLVLIQLPKKEAGAGLAFGGAASDALFGAGSGNVLTKATKYAATIFFVLALIIGVFQVGQHRRTVTELEKAVAEESSRAAAMPVAVPQQPAATPSEANPPLQTTPAPAQPATPPATNQ
jgi:preprotein translocase subunit SecG